MTDLLNILPSFPTTSYTHIIPPLERHLITVVDLLTLDPPEIARRAQIPVHDARRLAEDITKLLRAQLGIAEAGRSIEEATSEVSPGEDGIPRRNGNELISQSNTISTLDQQLDAALHGGIRTGYITEITGERLLLSASFNAPTNADSGAGKTQLLLTLLLSAQLPPPHGLGRQSLYISTEHRLPTTRLAQLLRMHPVLSAAATSSHSPPSLTRILTLQTEDLESQEHILRYQLPVALQRHRIGLVVIDSITANFRAEGPSAASSASAAHFAARSAQLAALVAPLRHLARQYDCAFVCANQVSDRFISAPPQVPIRMASIPHTSQSSSPFLASPPDTATSYGVSVDETAQDQFMRVAAQERFYTGWGDGWDDSGEGGRPEKRKTPALGLAWTNLVACRIALIKEAVMLSELEAFSGPRDDSVLQNASAGLTMAIGPDNAALHQLSTATWTPRSWRRWMRVVFAPWAEGVRWGDHGVEFEVWPGGVRAVVARESRNAVKEERGIGAASTIVADENETE